jgi:membrane protein insertase Oxa1/YidC/SpoIIIJ
MLLMPVMLGAMFFYAPAGLNLYWLTSNVWSIVQQGVSLRLLGDARGKDAAKEKRAR